MSALLVGVGGALGALLRFWVERWAVHRFHERVPWGTAIVNLVGAGVLAAVVGLEQRGLVTGQVVLLVGTGFCGSLTTFSGFIGQIENRLRHRSTRGLAVRYGIGVTAAGLALAYLAYTLCS